MSASSVLGLLFVFALTAGTGPRTATQVASSTNYALTLSNLRCPCSAAIAASAEGRAQYVRNAHPGVDRRTGAKHSSVQWRQGGCDSGLVCCSLAPNDQQTSHFAVVKYSQSASGPPRHLNTNLHREQTHPTAEMLGLAGPSTSLPHQHGGPPPTPPTKTPTGRFCSVAT